MLHIGCHLSIGKGFEHIGKEAESIGADTFQFFTRNPQGGKAKDIDAKEFSSKLLTTVMYSSEIQSKDENICISIKIGSDHEKD